MTVWNHIMRFFHPGAMSRMARESAEVTRLAREFRGHIREFEDAEDPFVAMSVRIAANAYEDRQEANIWRGPIQ